MCRRFGLALSFSPGRRHQASQSSFAGERGGSWDYPLNLSKGAWTKEVDKTVMWGAVVAAEDRDALIDYLSTNFTPDQLRTTPGAHRERKHPANSSVDGKALPTQCPAGLPDTTVALLLQNPK